MTGKWFERHQTSFSFYKRRPKRYNGLPKNRGADMKYQSAAPNEDAPNRRRRRFFLRPSVVLCANGANAHLKLIPVEMTLKLAKILRWPEKNIHKIFIPQKNIHFSQNPQKYWNSEFWTKKMGRAYVHVKISEYPPWALNTASCDEKHSTTAYRGITMFHNMKWVNSIHNPW